MARRDGRQHLAEEERRARAAEDGQLVLEEPRALGGGAGAELPTEERSRLLAVNERLQEGARTLRNAERTVLETEAIGASILGDLRTQRETIEHASGTLRGANDNLARSKRLIQGIARRTVTTRSWCAR